MDRGVPSDCNQHAIALFGCTGKRAPLWRLVFDLVALQLRNEVVESGQLHALWCGEVHDKLHVHQQALHTQDSLIPIPTRYGQHSQDGPSNTIFYNLTRSMQVCLGSPEERVVWPSISPGSLI